MAVLGRSDLGTIKIWGSCHFCFEAKELMAQALMCQACHGLDGLSKTSEARNIAGQIEPYLAAQLQAFRSGARKNDAMSMVAPSSDNDIGDLAAYFSAIEINIVKLPP